MYTICQFPLRNPHRLERLLQKHLARARRFSMGWYTYHFLLPNASPQSLRSQALFPSSGLTIIPRRARRTRRMLEARDAFSPAIRIMPVCRVGRGRCASVIIKIMSRICLCVARRQVIRHTHLRDQCHLMLISHEKHRFGSWSSCMRQLSRRFS